MPPKNSEKWKTSPEIIERVRTLALHMTDNEIVNCFNNEGLRTNKGNQYTLFSIKWIRHMHKIPSYNLRKEGELSINEAAKKFDVSHHVVRYWVERDMIKYRKTNGHRIWLFITPEKEVELYDKVNTSTKILRARKNKLQK